MTFIWPVMLFLLVLVPLAVVFYVWLQNRRRKLVANQGRLAFMRAAGREPGLRRHVPPVLFLLGLTILVVALARPQAVVALPRIEGTVILAFDVSGSMSATDLKPTRMDAAQVAARDFIQRQPSTVQVGVVAFSDSGISVQPPTSDQDALLASIGRLTPQRGTSLANGINASLNAIAASQKQQILGDTSGEPAHLSNLTPQPTQSPTPYPAGTYDSAVIVLLSDGDNNESPDPLALAKTAADRGVRIYTVGIGSAAGTNVHVNGFTVFTQLNEPMLKQIAQISGGEYFNAETEKDLRAIYDHLTPELMIRPEKTEVTSIFAGASVLVFLIGGVFSLMWFSRLP